MLGWQERRVLKTPMAESSSDSDPILCGSSGRRGPVRVTHGRARNQRSTDVTEKIHTLTSTLQDTNRNLRLVDQMLGRYRDYSNEQTEAIANLKETLEQSIDQLRSQRLLRNSRARSASLSSLYISDLDGGAATDSCRFPPTSPLRDSGDAQGPRRRRSRSSSVRFIDEEEDFDQLHSLHQSLRDLSSEQVRLGEDLSRELSRRNRLDAETKKSLEELSEKLEESERQEMVSERVERRLQEIEREMRTERHLVEKRQDQLGHISLQLQEALKKQEAKFDESEGLLKNKLRKSESEKSQLEQELQLSRKWLDQSEGSRETLLLQIEHLRSQLLKSEEHRVGLQHQVSQLSRQCPDHPDEQDDGRRFRTVAERSEWEKQDLERQILELRTELNRNTMLSEVDELRRCLERKDKEKAQFAAQIEVLTLDLEKREQQQLRMLDQLKEIRNRYEVCETEHRQANLQLTELARQVEESTKEAERYLSELHQSEALRLEADRKKEELKAKAQETIRQWKLKCRKVEQDMEKQSEAVHQLTDKNNQVLKEKDDLKAKLFAALHQIENLRKELNELLSKRVQQEEELHQKELKLKEAQSQQMDLEQEVRGARDTTNRLENELQEQSRLQKQTKMEREHLEEECAALNRLHEKDKERLLEMQEAVKNLSAIRAELANNLAEEERSKKEALKSLSDIKKQEASWQEEMTAAIRQFKLERDVHQRELEDLRSELQNVKAKHEQNIQELMKQFKQEQDEAESHIWTLKTEKAEDQNLVEAQRWQVENMKVECDRLTEELMQNEEANTKLKRKYQLMKQQLEEKDKQMSSEGDHLKRVEESRSQLKDQLLCLETEQKSILSMIGSEIDTACEIFSRDFVEKFRAISLTPGLQNDPHRWLAETKTKLQWLCEEVKEREKKERKLRHQLLLSRQQLKDLTQNKEFERQSLFKQIQRQDQLLGEIHREKKDMLEKSHRRDEEMEHLQDHVIALESSTRVALDHLESVPEKLSFLEDFKEFGDHYHPREVIEERYAKYKEIIESLQQQLDASKAQKSELQRCKSLFRFFQCSRGGTFLQLEGTQQLFINFDAFKLKLIYQKDAYFGSSCHQGSHQEYFCEWDKFTSRKG
ncbi:centrosomal protein of 128 kDa isoform X1 [Ornithorhynchus anatinus]|uniref:Centrosomal protein 128 n=1 Tax=Ornithorhynchus anatinus TaxID=9258 RepID=A0A6I8NSU3_ORNAN|nr:centrosomal protein of 128 kDa isoform X1 [Ornithorhynchus anatinus]